MDGVNKLAVIISSNKSKCYQVALSKSEEKAVANLIAHMHKGKIKVLSNELALAIGKI